MRPKTARATGGAPPEGASSARPSEADAFEYEYPGASWLAARAFRELEELGRLVEVVVAAQTRRHGLSHAALNALAVVEGNGGPLPVGEVGAHMHVTSGTTTSVLDTLERHGYVRRLADPGDRRRVLVDSTPEAQPVLDKLLPEIQQVATEVVGPLGDATLQRLLDVLGEVRESVAQLPDTLPPPLPRRTPARLKRT